MRKGFLLILIILLVGMTGIIWRFAPKPPHNNPESQTVTPPTQSSPNNGAKQTVEKPSVSSRTANSSNPAIPPAVMEYVKKIKADPQYDWKQLINFYGRVVDESNIPVTDASVHFEWTDISPTGNSEADTKSDGNGFFSLTDRRGKRLIVDISKNGYYSSGNARGGAFEYANPADGLFTPDPNNPVIFHLRKKGTGVELVTSNQGIESDLHFAPPTNGTPVFIDFINRKVGDSGQLKIEGWKELKNFKTAENNWGFRLTVPDGGLIEENDEFPFEAPEEGYQPVMEWHFKDGEPDWKGFLQEKFYIQFGNPPRYGIVTVETTAFAPGVYLNFAFNPTGSRNLEPK